MSRITILISFFLSAALTAQVIRNHHVPLKSWPAPLYWQPSLSESEVAGGKVHAEIRTGSAAVEPAFLVFVAMTPCRVVDTRNSSGFPSPFGPPSLASGTLRSFPIQSSTLCTIPSTAQAYSFNVTVIPNPLGAAVGYLTIWPEGQMQPNAVTLDDYPTGDIRNNAAIVPAGTPNGGISVITNGASDLVTDINGYYIAPSDTKANTALGLQALFSNTTGCCNTASGSTALVRNTTGNYNTASGESALAFNNTGTNNIAIGRHAAINVSGGNSNNIHIGTPGGVNDSGAIVIGDSSIHTSFVVAGVKGVALNNPVGVMIDGNGQLGTMNSSRRFKEYIHDMAEASSGLLRLRPVTFRYQKPFADGSKPLDYGLVAEEVAEIFPDLVVKDQEGQIETVQYHKLIPMLLNELQRLEARVETLEKTSAAKADP